MIRSGQNREAGVVGELSNTSVCGEDSIGSLLYCLRRFLYADFCSLCRYNYVCQRRAARESTLVRAPLTAPMPPTPFEAKFLETFFWLVSLCHCGAR
jgi:hypothetical protein